MGHQHTPLLQLQLAPPLNNSELCGCGEIKPHLLPRPRSEVQGRPCMPVARVQVRLEPYQLHHALRVAVARGRVEVCAGHGGGCCETLAA